MAQTSMIRKTRLTERAARSYSTLFNQQREGTWPPGIRLTERLTVWLEDEVEAILAAEAAGATKEERRDLVRDLVAARAQRLQRVAPGPVATPKAERPACA